MKASLGQLLSRKWKKNARGRSTRSPRFTPSDQSVGKKRTRRGPLTFLVPARRKTPPTPTTSVALAPADVARIPVALAPPPEHVRSALMTESLTRPNDELRRSIESFLLDQRSEHTRKAYGKDLKRFVQYLHLRKMQRGPEQIDRSVLIGYKESLLSENLQHTTVDRHLSTLRSFFQWLVDDGAITKSPAVGVRFLKPKRLSTTQGFSDAEVNQVLNQPNLHLRTGALHYAVLMVLFYCGLRRSEVCALRSRNIQTEREHRVLRLQGKGNKERQIVLIPPVWNAIRHYFRITQRNLERDEPLFVAARKGKSPAQPLDPSLIFYIVTQNAKKAGITHRVSPHSCRATAISNARDHKVPDRAIQEFAGWASPDMIVHYDKRRTSIDEAASHAIHYGEEARRIPWPEGLEGTTPSEESAERVGEIEAF